MNRRMRAGQDGPHHVFGSMVAGAMRVCHNAHAALYSCLECRNGMPKAGLG